MNKKVLKNLLITLGTVYLFIIFLLMNKYNNDIFETISNMINGIFMNFNIILLPGITLLICGFMIDVDNKENSINKYVKLRYLGLVPIIAFLLDALLSTIIGATFIGDESYGFDAFYMTIVLFFITPWPLISLILILFSNYKIKKLKKIKKDESKKVDVVSEILRYKELLDAGAITQEEYDAKKKQLLDL